MTDQTQLLKYIIITKMRKWESHLVTNIEFCLVQNRDGDGESVNSATILVHKLVSVLESIEKLPVYLYDTPGSGYGLQVMQSGKIALCTVCR
jgi:E3 ubiquitin-protein ligase HECTD1